MRRTARSGPPQEPAVERAADDGLPAEELLRLDDGTALPAELAELRSMLQLHQSLMGASERAASDDPEEEALAERLAALHAAKAEQVRDCLLAFDDGLLFLHDRLLDHEVLVKRLAAVRKQRTAVPAGKCRFDESVAVDDDDPALGNRAAESDDDDLDLNSLLSVDSAATMVKQQRSRRAPSGSSGEQALAGRAATGMGPAACDEDDEEALDQKVAASRQNIKTWLRAREAGDRSAPLPGAGEARPTAKYSQRLRERTAMYKDCP